MNQRTVTAARPSQRHQPPAGGVTARPRAGPLQRSRAGLRPSSISRSTGRGGRTLLVALALNYLFISVLFPGQPQRTEVSYTFFKQQVEADNVAEISSRATRSRARSGRARPYPPDRGDRREDGPGLLHRAARRSPIPASRRCSTRTASSSTPGRSTSPRNPVADAAAQLRPDDAADRRLPLAVEARRRQRWAAALFGHGQEPGQALRPDGRRRPRGHLRRRGRHRRGQGRAGRDRRLPEGSRRSTRAWAAPRPRACCWSARPARARRCWREAVAGEAACRSSAWAPASSSR